MKLGDIIESAIWLDGTESREQRIAYEQLVRESMTEACQQEGWVHGEVTFIEKQPGDERVPPVPKHIEKAGALTDIRLLVGETRIIGKAMAPEPSFVYNLEHKDLERLRQITKRIVKKKSGVDLSDAEADLIIDDLGPEAALEALRNNTTVSQFH